MKNGDLILSESYDDLDLIHFLDVFIYLDYLIQENTFTEKGLDFNFDRAIKIICENGERVNSLVSEYDKQEAKLSINNLCEIREIDILD